MLFLKTNSISAASFLQNLIHRQLLVYIAFLSSYFMKRKTFPLKVFFLIEAHFFISLRKSCLILVITLMRIAEDKKHWDFLHRVKSLIYEKLYNFYSIWLWTKIEIWISWNELMVIAENCSCDENGLNRRCSSYENEVSERLMSFRVTCFWLN